jgi:hypothetical protein
MSDNEQDIKVDVTDTSNIEKVETPMERFFYHQRRALEETGKALEALLPTDFRKHGGEASREFAKGFRVLVDAAIDELKRVSEREEDEDEEIMDEEEDSNDDDDDSPSTTGKTKVKVKLD